MLFSRAEADPVTWRTETRAGVVHNLHTKALSKGQVRVLLAAWLKLKKGSGSSGSHPSASITSHHIPSLPVLAHHTFASRVALPYPAHGPIPGA